MLQFGLVEDIRGLIRDDPNTATVHAELEHPEWLLLAALIFETVDEAEAPVELARRLAHRLDLGAQAEEELALLVGDSDLLRAAARRVDGLEEEVVFPVVSHLGRPERARALYLLTLALNDLTLWERERLDRLFEVVLGLLEQPEVAGRATRNLVERRRAEAKRLVGADERVGERIEHAPRAYLLAQDPRDIVRQAALLVPLPARNQVRVAVEPSGPSEWRVEVGSPRPPGSSRDDLRCVGAARTRHRRRRGRHVGRRRCS